MSKSLNFVNSIRYMFAKYSFSLNYRLFPFVLYHFTFCYTWRNNFNMQKATQAFNRLHSVQTVCSTVSYFHIWINIDRKRCQFLHICHDITNCANYKTEIPAIKSNHSMSIAINISNYYHLVLLSKITINGTRCSLVLGVVLLLIVHIEIHEITCNWCGINCDKCICSRFSYVLSLYEKKMISSFQE